MTKRSQRILLVDDAIEERLTLRAMLESLGFEHILEAESGEACLAMLGVEAAPGDAAAASAAPTVAHPGSVPGVDLILMDFVMPGLNGPDVCKRLRRSPRWADVPVIMVTGSVPGQTIEAAFDAGAIDFITKPVSPVELKVRANSALTLKREMDERKRRESELVRTTRELERLNSKLARQSQRDGLTGVANRRHLDDTLDDWWQEYASAGRGEPMSIVLADLDCFKLYNDTYGHQAGDDCLRQVAGVLKDCATRPGDLVARYGGEEFAIVLCETGTRGALDVAERIRTGVRQLGRPHGTSDVADVVTISLGTATTAPTADVPPSVLIERADDALYRAKANGRDRIESAPLVAL